MEFLRNKLNSTIINLKNRILWADIAKAIAILLIIWGHGGSGNQNIFYRNVLYSFNIPIFLIVSGYLMKFPAKEELNIKSYLKFVLNNFIFLIVPYLFWGIFFSNFSVKNVLPILYGSYQTIKTVNVVGALWFIPCFFFARIFAYSIMCIFNNIKLKKLFIGLSMVGLMAIGFVLPLLDNGYFFSFNIAFVLAAFILLGVILKDALNLLNKSKWYVILIIFIVCSVGFYFGTFFRGEDLELVCMYNGNYGNKFWFIYNAIFGSGVVISLSMLIAKVDCKFVRCIQFVGTQTLGLLILHVPFMRQVMMQWFTDIGFVNPDWLVALIAAVCTLIVCLLLNILIGLVCPVLVGQQSKKVFQS